jgi:hypothetical protein
MAMFSRLIIRTFQLVFSARTVFFSHINQPEQCFSLFFQHKRTGPYWALGPFPIPLPISFSDSYTSILRWAHLKPPDLLKLHFCCRYRDRLQRYRQKEGGKSNSSFNCSIFQGGIASSNWVFLHPTTHKFLWPPYSLTIWARVRDLGSWFGAWSFK